MVLLTPYPQLKISCVQFFLNFETTKKRQLLNLKQIEAKVSLTIYKLNLYQELQKNSNTRIKKNQKKDILTF